MLLRDRIGYQHARQLLATDSIINMAKTCMPYQVCRHYGIERLGLQHHSTRHGVDKHFVSRDIREVFRNGRGDLVPENHAVSLSIALGHYRQELAWTFLGRLKSEPHDALHAVAREDGYLSGHLPGLAAVRSPSLACILSLAVLTDDYPVKISWLAVA